MLTLPSSLTTAKNQHDSTGAWLILLTISLAPSTIIRLVRNTEDITWPTDGDLFQAFPFEVEDVREDGKGGLPSFAIKCSNVTRVLVPYLEASDGGAGATVRIQVVHSDNLGETNAALDEVFDVLGCSLDNQWVTIRLGAENPMRARSPRDRYLKDHCRYKEFKGELCGYAGAETACNRSFARCVELGNISRFGGFPGVEGGVYV